jgi:hypothetical protein
MPLFQYSSRFEPMSNHELRGVPLVGGRRSSAIQGTDPLPALLAKERAGKLNLTPPEAVPARSEPLLLVPERKGRPLVRTGVVEAGRFFK